MARDTGGTVVGEEVGVWKPLRVGRPTAHDLLRNARCLRAQLYKILYNFEILKY